MTLEDAIRVAVRRGLEAVGLERIRSEEFFGLNQSRDPR
jgi:hypothetical protein